MLYGAAAMAYRHHFSLSAAERQAAADRQTVSLAGLAVVLCLVVAGLYLTQRLAATAALELAGRDLPIALIR